ncbi:MAG: DUF6036 family nucleotidyltransferase [Bacteroidota bacterium]
MFQSLLAKIGSALVRADIPYMVIGGQAVLLHGEPRLTRDISITLGADNSALNTLLELVRAVGLQVAVEDVDKFVRETNVLPVADQATGVRIGLIFSFMEYERQAMGRAVAVEMEDTSVRFAAVEDLVIHKLIAGRPRDSEDIRGILARNHAMDREYLKVWLRSLSEALGRDLQKEFEDLV